MMRYSIEVDGLGSGNDALLDVVARVEEIDGCSVAFADSANARIVVAYAPEDVESVTKMMADVAKACEACGAKGYVREIMPD